jgi:uncharacterized protein YjbI with pentapeptide repeats
MDADDIDDLMKEVQFYMLDKPFQAALNAGGAIVGTKNTRTKSTRPDFTRKEVLQMVAAGHTNFAGCNLTGLDLSSVNFDIHNVANAVLHGTKMSRATLEFACFVGADLSLADLSYAAISAANLNHADLISANLTHANLSNAKKHNTQLVGANLTKTNRSKARLNGANLAGAVVFFLPNHSNSTAVGGRIPVSYILSSPAPGVPWVLGTDGINRSYIVNLMRQGCYPQR